MAIKDFVAIQDLDDIVASPRNTFALKQGRHIGYCTSTVMDFLSSQDITIRLLRNNTKHVLPITGNEWHAVLCHSVGLICFDAPLVLPQGVHVHTIGHFYAVVLIVRSNISYYRVIDSLNNGKAVHFADSVLLSQYLRTRNILEAVQVVSTEHGNAGEHPDLPPNQIVRNQL